MTAGAGVCRAFGRRLGHAGFGPRQPGKPVSSIVAFGALVKTGPAIVLMLVALLTLDNR
ncbi:MAG: hypothetical protein JWM53_7134 [bacterium]|jgi:hypothetical protein|nr:hypothetical protein [bacterium]